MDGLEAHYALLREVSARGHAVQTRLRTSLPLLWTENALIMNGATRRRRTGAKERPRRVIGSTALAIKDTDFNGADAAERLLVEWSSASRHRRMEWEVSRRIARVDRELQVKPRGSRYWHKTPPEVSVANPTPSIARRKRVSSAAQTEPALLRSHRPSQAKLRSAESVVAGDEHYMTPTASWKANTAASEVKEAALPKHKRDLTKPRHRRSGGDVMASFEDLGGVSAKQPASPTAKASNPDTPQASQAGESRDRDQPPPPHFPEESAGVTPSAVERLVVGESRVPSPDLTTSEAPSAKLSSPCRVEEASSQAAVSAGVRPSSIGRQVQSEYRTMPSVASFGPGLAASGRGRGRATANLNADVLRRLFSDLDSDRDGHINRIEVCLALHRLQIAVPAVQIASFFRNVYASSGGGKSSYRPLQEIINYKQFVAFVTAAFDKQKQAAVADATARRTAVERVHQSKKKGAEATDTQPMFPSTAVPMLQKRSNGSARANLNPGGYQASSMQRQALRYQVEDVEPTVTNSIELTNQIVSEMPDVLMGRVLADAVCEDQDFADTGRRDARALVRMSLEGLPRTSDDDKLTTRIVQELIREHLRANLDSDANVDDSEDLTGLLRAAAFFERQVQAVDGAAAQATEDASSGQSMEDWLGIVTEEQVSALIHEVWRENASCGATILPVSRDTDPLEGSDQDVELTETPPEPDVNSNQASSGDDAATLEKTAPIDAAEDVQARDIAGEHTPDPQPTAVRNVRTHLGRLVLNHLHEDQASAVTVPDTLRLLRQKRLKKQERQHRRMLSQPPHTIRPNEQRGVLDEEQDDDSKLSSTRSSVSRGVKSPSGSFVESTHDKENCGSLNIAHEAPQHHTASEASDCGPEEENVQCEQPLRVFDLPVRGSWNSGNARSSSSSSSKFTSDSVSSHSSSLSCSVAFNAVDRHVRGLNPRHVDSRGHTRQYRPSGDLSEGEVDPNDPGNVSEGEITGRRRERHVRAKNSSSRRFFQRSRRLQRSSEGRYSSAESGELHSHVISSASSSRESGELLKVRPLLRPSIQDAA